VFKSKSSNRICLYVSSLCHRSWLTTASGSNSKTSGRVTVITRLYVSSLCHRSWLTTASGSNSKTSGRVTVITCLYVSSLCHRSWLTTASGSNSKTSDRVTVITRIVMIIFRVNNQHLKTRRHHFLHVDTKRT